MTAARSELGRIEQTEHGATLTFVRELAAARSDVWRALTEPHQLAAWMDETTIDLRVGGSIEIHFDDGAINGVITALVPEKVLAYTWRETEHGQSVVRFELSDSPTGTTLELTHTKLTPGSASGFAAGWHHHLDLLTDHLAGRRALWDDARCADLRDAYTSKS